MPSREILERRVGRNTGHLRGEIDRNFGGDIRNREPIAGDERLVADLRVEPLKLLRTASRWVCAVFRKLLEPPLNSSLVCWNARAAAPNRPTRRAGSTSRSRLLALVLAHQVGLRMQPFEVAANRDRLRQCVPSSSSITGRPPAGFLASIAGVRFWPVKRSTCSDRNLESLFRDENSEPSRIRGESKVIYFHSGCNLKPAHGPVNGKVSRVSPDARDGRRGRSQCRSNPSARVTDRPR